MPKLRVAPAAGAAIRPAAADTAKRKVRIRSPSATMVKAALRATGVSGPHLGNVALGAAAALDVARAHDADVRSAAGMRPNVARSGDRYFQLLRLDGAGIDVPRSGDVIIRGLRLARTLGSAGAGDCELELLNVDLRDVDPARSGDDTFELVAGHMVDTDVARSGDRRS